MRKVEKEFFAVEHKGEIVAIFKTVFDAVEYARMKFGKCYDVHGWIIPAETFQFEE
ncbi:MAG: hypothetical protein IE937_09730 [Gammaproteobacteria bacterium]|nr:hypothetical protein [Gammaproteobacteria bacterium]